MSRVTKEGWVFSDNFFSSAGNVVMYSDIKIEKFN